MPYALPAIMGMDSAGNSASYEMDSLIHANMSFLFITKLFYDAEAVRAFTFNLKSRGNP
ncbi:hypothetical protein SAMN05216414_101156 [Nitrosovibrio sp. Nv17]|nr:hypothetical protein SAMN05216414_101156 [Nitrosovibrio sp. Nv17]